MSLKNRNFVADMDKILNEQQLLLLKDKIAQDGIRETFKKVKEIGFSTVELSHTKPSILK